MSYDIIYSSSPLVSTVEVDEEYTVIRICRYIQAIRIVIKNYYLLEHRDEMKYKINKIWTLNHNILGYCN